MSTCLAAKLWETSIDYNLRTNQAARVHEEETYDYNNYH